MLSSDRINSIVRGIADGLEDTKLTFLNRNPASNEIIEVNADDKYTLLEDSPLITWMENKVYGG